MSIIYNINIEPKEKENSFHITWQNSETNAVHSFDQDSEITFEESQRLWQWPRCQLAIGEKLFRFLDGDNRHFQQALDQGNRKGELLQIHLNACKQTADWPFELLAQDNTFLLPHRIHLVRYVSDWGTEKEISPEDRNLKLLFMACSAMDVKPELDFEKEEEAIFHITENLPIDMEVEDSGSLEGLRSQLQKEHFDVVHLSGHANIDKNGRPYFVMEDETGYLHNVFPEELWNEALIENPPRLLFLSGCRTGEVPDLAEEPESMVEGSFARLLVEKYNVPAVLGWGRSVSDQEASHAGKMIFHELSRGRSILEAVQRARFELIKNFTNTEKPAWPLLRLYSSSMPLNAIVKKEQRILPKPRRMKHVFLKNSQIQVLAEGFVGRRRQLQTGLRALKQDNDKVGVVLLGTGGLGKSCLAGKICERFPHHTLIVVHGRFNTITMENALTDAFIAAQDEKGQQILSQKIEMKDKLSHLCSTSFKEKDYLLLLDDFEQNLQGAEKGKPGPILVETAELLKVLLHYLPFSGKMTQLIITSRYEFSLTEQDKDLVNQRLEKVWLTSFQKSEQRKKIQELKNILNYPDQSLAPQFLRSGHGNPRLMEWVDVLVGQLAAAEVPQLLEAIRDKQEDFIRGHVIRELLQKGGEELTRFLCWFSIYRQPVLLEGVEQVAEKAGLEGWKELLHEGMSLSLVEHDQARFNYQVTHLLRKELLNGLENHHTCHEAAFAYYKKVCEAQDPIDTILTEEWIFHALGCGEEEVASCQGGELINHLREHLALQDARRVGEWILKEKKQTIVTEHDALLMNELGITISKLGDNGKAISYFEQVLAIDERVFGKEHPTVARDLNNMGVEWRYLGESRKAIGYYEQALAFYKTVYGDTHQEVATTLNNIGLAWFNLGDNDKAISYFEQALAIDEHLFGKNNPEVARVLSNLGGAWTALWDSRKAIEYYEQALAIDVDVYGKDHPKVAIRLNNLGVPWMYLGDNRKAISYFEQALAIDERVFGKKHPRIALRLNNLGEAWRGFGKPEKAIEYYEQALTIVKTIYGDTHPQVAASLRSLGAAWSALGDNRKSISHFEQALAIDECLFGKGHPAVAEDLNNLGEAWRVLGITKKAIVYYEQALVIWKSVYGDTHPYVAISLNNLGEAWRISSESRKAISYFEQALAIDERVFGKEHPNVASRLNNLGAAYFSLGNKTKAKHYFQNAYNIFKKVYGELHPHTQNVKEWLDHF